METKVVVTQELAAHRSALILRLFRMFIQKCHPFSHKSIAPGSARYSLHIQSAFLCQSKFPLSASAACVGMTAGVEN